MKIGLVGYQGSGKSTLFHWLTGVAPDPSAGHTGQSAMATLPEPRVGPLCEIYKPKKVTLAALEIDDTPGLSRAHRENAARLGTLREAGCLVMVTAAFSGADPVRDLAGFQEDLLLADLQIVEGRVERLRDSLKKPRPTREQDLAEIAALEPLHAALESGKSLVNVPMTPEQRQFTRSFRLLTERPRLIVVNVADYGTPPDKHANLDPPHEVLVSPLSLELELSLMPEADRAEFERDLNVSGPRRDDFLRAMLRASGQILFFTCGQKEVRTWLLPAGGTALDAAANIHTDLAQGFVRAEVFKSEDLLRLGSEREIKAHNLLRREPKDYVVQEGDVLFIQHNA